MLGQRLSETIALAFEALSTYRLRTALSVLGVVFGVSAIVATVSVNEGARDEALRQVSRLGLDNVVVRFRGVPANGEHLRRWFGLTVGDAERITHLTTDITFVSPLVEFHERVIGRRVNRDVMVLAVNAQFTRIMGLSIAYGRGLSTLDDANLARVCVIGSNVSRLLFSANDSSGKTIALHGETYRVVGVLRDTRTDTRAIESVSPRSFEDAIVIPLSAWASHRLDADKWLRVDEIWVRGREGLNPAIVGDAVARALAVPRPGGPDYDVVVPIELLKQRLRLQRTFNFVVGSVGALTLLVAGVGIMNVMLTSVLERTSEIGLRRTVGATRPSIVAQFLTESVLISLAGGTAGLVIGCAAALAISHFGRWPTVISPGAVTAAILVSVVVGLLSGIYPAFRASTLNPIDAVRYE